MESRVLMKWRKNNNLVVILCVFTTIACIGFYSLYAEKRNYVFLVIFLSLIILFIILFATSFKSWNEYLYIDEEKIWMKRKENLIEWKIEDVIACRIIAKPRWTRLYKIEIMTRLNSKKLIFECNDKVEKKLLEITKGKEVWKIFREAFK